MSAMPVEETAERADRERIAHEVMDRCLDLVEPVSILGPAKFNGDGEWSAGEYRFPCPLHGRDDPTSDGLRLSIHRNYWWEPRWWCPKCEDAGVGYMDLFAGLLAEGVPYEALPDLARGLPASPPAHPPMAPARPPLVRPTRPAEPLLDEDAVAAWSEGLLSQTGDRTALRFLVETRLWSPDCIKLLHIGWHYGRQSLAIPVRDAHGALVNVRLWNPKKPKDSNKRWQWLVRGTATVRLWPLPSLLAAADGDRVYLVGGEPDAMVAMSLGAVAVTSLCGEGKGGRLRAEDLHYLAGKRVVVVYDSDATGRAGAKAAVDALRAYGGCRTVHSRDLFPHRNDGSDLTDWIREGNGLPMPRPRKAPK